MANGGGVAIPMPTADSVVIVPEQINGAAVTTVSLQLPSGQTVQADAADGITPTTTGADVTLSPVAVGTRTDVRIVTVSGACTTSSVVVLRAGSGLAAISASTDHTTVSATITKGLGVLSLAVKRNDKPPTWGLTFAYDTSPDSGGYRFEISGAATLQQKQITITPTAAKVQLLSGSTSLFLGAWQPAAGVISVSPCDILAAVNAAIPAAGWSQQFGTTQLKLTGIQADCGGGPDVVSITLNAGLSNGLISKSDIAIKAKFETANVAPQFALSDATPITFGAIALSSVNVQLTLDAAGQPQLTLMGSISVAELGTRFSSSIVSVVIDQHGLRLAPGSSALITIDKMDASLTAFDCSFNTETLGFNSCNVAVNLTLPTLGGVLTATVDSSNGFVIAGNLDVPLGNNYDLLIANGTVADPDPDAGVIVSAKSATLRGGLLGTGGVTITQFSAGNGALCGTIAPSAIITGGPFSLANTHVTIIGNSCTGSGTTLAAKPLKLNASTAATRLYIELTADALLSYPTNGKPDANGNFINVNVSGLKADIPLTGQPVKLLQPKSISIKGMFFDRTVVGVCPASLIDPKAPTSSPVGSLPSLLAGVQKVTLSGGDVKQPDQIFRILDDGTYVVCAGLHLTPNQTAAATSDLVDAQIVFTTPGPALQSVRVSYAGSGVSTKIGTRTMTLTKLDLSYSAAQTDWIASDYATVNHIPLNCSAPLFGEMTVSLQSIAAVGAAGGAASTNSTLDAQLGLGKSCLFADVYGSVTIPITPNSSVLLKELHFASGPHTLPWPVPDQRKKSKSAAVAATTVPASPEPLPTVWYSKVNMELNAGQGGIALHDAGLEHYDNAPARVSGGIDAGRTIQMNVGWIVSGLTGLVTGLFLHKI